MNSTKKRPAAVFSKTIAADCLKQARAAEPLHLQGNTGRTKRWFTKHMIPEQLGKEQVRGNKFAIFL